MFYVIDKDALWERTFEEVSRVADESVREDGTPLYDSVVLTSKDRPQVEHLVDEAVDSLLRRAFDICKYSPETYQDDYGETQLTGRLRLQFHVPDLDESTIPVIEEEVSKYISLHAAAFMLQSRGSAAAETIASRSQASMDRAVTLLKSRKAPNEIW